MTDDQTRTRATRLLDLHRAPELLTVVNVWDVISATVVADVARHAGARDRQPLDRRLVRLPGRRADPAST